MRKFVLCTIIGLSAFVGSMPAAMAAIDLSLGVATYGFASLDASGNPIPGDVMAAGSNGFTNNDTPFWTATTNFTLSSTTGEELSISQLAADDLVVVELNGVAVAQSGIGGPGSGLFFFSPTSSPVTLSFLNNGPQSIVVSGPFVAGSNTLELIVNNNNEGIAGTSLTGGPSSLQFVASVGSAVPEASTWSMMIVGFAGLGFAGYRRSRKAIVA